MEQSSNKSRAFLSKLDDQQLRQILLAEVESDDTDVDLIRNITAVLESRDHAGKEIDAQKAYQSFVEEHAEDSLLYDELLKKDDFSDKRKHVRISRLARVGIVAAIILSLILITTGIASAAGFDLWGAFTKWTAKTFGISVGYTEKMEDYMLPNDSCHEVRQIVEEYGISESVVPHYLPKGFRFFDSSENETYEGRVVTGVYSNDMEEIVLFYVIGPSESSILYPKDQDEPQMYEINGVTHYLFGNENEWVVIWQRDGIGCQISGVCSREELLKIINSIYEGK